MSLNPIERLQWIALTMVGLVAGLALALALGVPIFAIFGAMLGTPMVLSVVGLSLGTAQWPVIRRHFSRSWYWIAVSTLGMAVGLTAGVTFVEQVGRAVLGGPVNFRMLGVAARAVSFAMIGFSGGLSVGLAQWLVLRRQADQGWTWILVNSWSLGLGLGCGSLFADALKLRSGSFMNVLILLLIGSATTGACTVRTLGQLVRRRNLQMHA